MKRRSGLMAGKQELTVAVILLFPLTLLTSVSRRRMSWLSGAGMMSAAVVNRPANRVSVIILMVACTGARPVSGKQSGWSRSRR